MRLGVQTARVEVGWVGAKEVGGDYPTACCRAAAAVGVASGWFWREFGGASAGGQPEMGGAIRMGPLAPPIPPLPTRAGSGVL